MNYRVYMLVIAGDTGKELAKITIESVAGSHGAEALVEQLTANTWILMSTVNALVRTMREWFAESKPLIVYGKELIV